MYGRTRRAGCLGAWSGSGCRLLLSSSKPSSSERRNQHPLTAEAAEQVGLVPSERSDAGSLVTRIYVCVTCRTAPDEQPRAGARLHDELRRTLGDDPGFDVVPVECLSVCKRPCTVSFAAPGKWTYVYGDLLPDASLAVIGEAARLYAEAPDGLIPWRLRPDAIKKGVVARVPPLPHPSEINAP